MCIAAELTYGLKMHIPVGLKLHVLLNFLLESQRAEKQLLGHHKSPFGPEKGMNFLFAIIFKLYHRIRGMKSEALFGYIAETDESSFLKLKLRLRLSILNL